MKIAVIGSGNIGGALGTKWATAGHDVVFGTRDVASTKVQAVLSQAGAHARADIIGNAIEWSEIVVLAIPGTMVADLAGEHGPVLDSKIVVDATNQFGAPVMNNVATIAAAAPGATVYRAFNSLGWENFAEPVLDGLQADLFFCGPDGDARALIEELIGNVGLRPIYVGDLQQVATVDAVGMLWGALVFGQGMDRRLAFKVLTAR